MVRVGDNIFVAAVADIKYEEVYLKAYQTVAEARTGINAYLEFYNRQRPHQALGYRTPAEVYQHGQEERGAAAEKAGLPSGLVKPSAGVGDAGDTDAFLRKYNGDGDHLRTVQFGTESLEEGSDVVVDVAGNVYVTGFVGGAFSGQDFLGGRNDAYVVKFDASLTQVWTRQFGTPDRDLATAVAVGLRGSLYVVGGTEGALAGQASSGKADAFLMKLVGP